MSAIEVNGEPRSVRFGLTVLELLRDLDLDPEKVAVELDRRILPKHAWQGTLLAPGSQLEIVQFVGGG